MFAGGLCNAWLSFHPDRLHFQASGSLKFFCKTVSDLSLLPGSINILYENLEQGSAFTRIAWPSFLSCDCYVNESVGCRCDLQAPTQQESPASELLIGHTKKGKEALPGQAEGQGNFRSLPRLRSLCRDVKDHHSPCYYW